VAFNSSNLSATLGLAASVTLSVFLATPSFATVTPLTRTCEGVLRTAGTGVGLSVGSSQNNLFTLAVPTKNNAGYVGVNVPGLYLGWSVTATAGQFESLDFAYTGPASGDPGLAIVVQDGVSGGYYITKASVKSTKVVSVYHYTATPLTVTPTFNALHNVNKAAFLFYGGSAANSNSITNSGITYVGSGDTINGYSCDGPLNFCNDTTIDYNFNFEFSTNNLN
jgi:hypothetical protein